MFTEIFKQAWTALGRNPIRSFLTMSGISWGIVAVTLLLSYGSGFRGVLMYTFEVFGKGAVIAWPGTTSEQAGGERAGKPVRFEEEDAEWVKAQSPLIKRVTRETVRFQGVSYGERLSSGAVRGVYPEYGEMRNETPTDGRWITPEDIAERRRVAFLGARLRKKLFSGEPNKMRAKRCVDALKRAKLIKETRTGRWQLTPEGSKVLKGETDDKNAVTVATAKMLQP